VKQTLATLSVLVFLGVYSIGLPYAYHCLATRVAIHPTFLGGIVIAWALILLGVALLLVVLPVQRRYEGPLPLEAYRFAHSIGLVGLFLLLIAFTAAFVEAIVSRGAR
jgi:hypothetical protein